MGSLLKHTNYIMKSFMKTAALVAVASAVTLDHEDLAAAGAGRRAPRTRQRRRPTPMAAPMAAPMEAPMQELKFVAPKPLMAVPPKMVKEPEREMVKKAAKEVKKIMKEARHYDHYSKKYATWGPHNSEKYPAYKECNKCELNKPYDNKRHGWPEYRPSYKHPSYGYGSHRPSYHYKSYYGGYRPHYNQGRHGYGHGYRTYHKKEKECDDCYRPAYLKPKFPCNIPLGNFNNVPYKGLY